MKTIMIALALMCSIPCISHAGAKIDSGLVVRDTLIKNVRYAVRKGSKGGLFIWVTSRDGKLYKRYFKK
jgi:hypothetical protein